MVAVRSWDKSCEKSVIWVDTEGHKNDSDADEDIHDLSAYNGFACHFI